jgi:hypothetical protein
MLGRGTVAIPPSGHFCPFFVSVSARFYFSSLVSFLSSVPVQFRRNRFVHLFLLVSSVSSVLQSAPACFLLVIGFGSPGVTPSSREDKPDTTFDAANSLIL